MKSITARGANYLKKNEFPLLVRRSHGAPSRSSKNAPTHTHDFSELVVISKGRTLQSIDGCKIPIGTGDVFFFHGNQSPFFHGHQYLESLNVLFDPHALKLPEEELRSIPGYCTLLKIDCDHNMDPQFPHHLHLSVPQLLAVESMIAQIHDEILQTPPGYQPLLRSKLVELLIYLSRACKEPETTGNKNTHQANKIISILEKKFYQPWTLDELALLAGMSKSNLLTTFRQATSQTPIEYLNQIRIRQASELLQTTDHYITEIAHTVGFNDSNYFTRKFRKITGKTPKSFRAQAQAFKSTSH